MLASALDFASYTVIVPDVRRYNIVCHAGTAMTRRGFRSPRPSRWPANVIGEVGGDGNRDEVFQSIYIIP